MIGLLRLNSKYRFVSNGQQLTKLLNDIQKGRAHYETVIVDANLTSKKDINKIIPYLFAVVRPRAISILFIGDKDIKLDWRMEYQITDDLKLLAESRYKED